MEFSKREKVIIAICLIAVFLFSFFRFLSPILFSSEDGDFVLEKRDYEIEESEKVEEFLEKTAELMVIHIAGQVKNPGVYEIEEGKRVIDLVELAGGLLEDANLDSLNLARKLEDEEKITIYKIGEEIESFTEEKDSLIDLNKATLEELKTLPGVGDKTAEKIINYREKNKFSCIEDIMNVSGIGEKKFESLKEFIKVRK